MPEIRTDWLTGRTVILAENRALRPNEFATVQEPATAVSASRTPCPFCPGQESITPPAVYTKTDDDGRWQIRVVPNKYPALSLEDPTAMGAHEVIIESARHVDRMSALSVAELGDVLDAYRARLAHWRASDRFQFGLIFKNLGPGAGASLAHVHSQLVALPQLPPPVAAEFDRARQFLAQEQACPYCRLIDDERQAKQRIVLDRDGLIAFCPYASLQPCEVWLLPTAHEPWFERPPTTAASESLASILHELLVRIEAITPNAAYNLLVRTAPWQEAAAACGHWRIEILPRANPLAGFELATQIHINPLCPSRAAQRLRSS